MGHHRFLFFHRNPVEQIYGSCLGIVVAGDFLFQQSNEKSFEIEVAGQESEFLQHQFRPAEALRVLIVQMFGEIGLDFVAAGQLALHFPLDGKAGLFAVELQNFIDGME